MMKLSAKILAFVIAVVISGPIQADDWAPNGPLTIQIGFGAGGSTDTMGRVLANVIEENTGWNVVVENKPGGGGVAMFTRLSQVPARGTTIGMGVSIPVLVQLVQRGDQLPFTVDDFAYLGTIAKSELALVAHKDAPFDDLDGMIAYAKEQGQIPVATMAAPQTFVMQATMRRTGAKFNLVTADGGAEIMKLILGRQVLAGFASGAHFPYLESGDMKIIAGVNQDRLSYAPGTRTFVENGINVFVDPVFFLAMTKGTDPKAVAAIADAIDIAIQSDAIAEIVRNSIKASPVNLGPEGTQKMMSDGLAAAQILFTK